jgi:putative ATP-binding cassette transporter
VEGTRLSYRHAADFPLAVREASIPAGYFYSDTEDMGRWIEIWTGSTVIPEDLAEPLSAVKARLVNEGDYYSGWELFADGVTGHSGGTPNYSSRVVFSEDRKIGVCVLSNLNVAATTDSLCNSIYDTVAGRTPGGLAADIWTVFDLIFTGISVAGILLFAAAFLIRKKVPLIVLDAFLAVLLVLVFILFPVIFGAGMKEILFTWAPWSMTGGLLIIAADIVLLSVRLFRPAGDGSAT